MRFADRVLMLRFGAVMEEFELRDALNNILSVKPEVQVKSEPHVAF